MGEKIIRPPFYNSGIYDNGGGGFKEAGELIDGDFIEIENNTISTYTNDNRNELNFFVKVKDGEIASAIVEIENNTNASVKVFVEKNGFLYILSNIGGDTINAGDEYYLRISGDTYLLELKTSTPVTPSYAEIDGKIYGIVNIGGMYWTTENIKIDVGKIFEIVSDGTNFQRVENIPYMPDVITTRGEYYYRPSIMGAINNKLSGTGWHVPSRSEVQYRIQNKIVGDLTSVNYGGSDTYGFKEVPHGICETNAMFEAIYNLNPAWEGMSGNKWSMMLSDWHYLYGGINSLPNNVRYSYAAAGDGNYNRSFHCIRLCKSI